MTDAELVDLVRRLVTIEDVDERVGAQDQWEPDGDEGFGGCGE